MISATIEILSILAPSSTDLVLLAIELALLFPAAALMHLALVVPLSYLLYVRVSFSAQLKSRLQ